MILREAPGIDAVDDIDSAQGVLIDRIGVIHVELGLGDNSAEFGDITAQQTGFRHHAEGLIRVLSAHQQVKEQPRGFRIATQAWRYQIEIAGDGGEGVGMQVEFQPVCHFE